MKKQIYSLGLMLAAAFTLTNCAKEIEGPVQDLETVGYPFEIVASTVDTKTVNAGMATNWVDGDQINLIHKESENEEAVYVYEEAFTIASDDLAEGRFTGELAAPLTSGNHDWYVLYPYSSFTKSPEKSGYLPIGCEPAKGKTQIQEGNNNMAHIAGANYPLWGNCKGLAYDEKPVIEMSHVSSLVEVVVTNTTDAPLTVENIAFTAGDDLVGTYYINFSGENVVCTNSGAEYVSNTATLKVNNAEPIETGNSAKFYLAVRPFTAKAGTFLTLAVNGHAKDPMELASDVIFHAGKIKTLNYAYDYVAPVGEQTVTFDFTSADELTDLGITLPDVDNGTNVTSLAKGQVTLVAEGGSTTTRIYNSAGKYDLRAYKGATLTFSVPSGYIITDVTLEGSATSISTSVVPSNPVVLTVAAGASTQKISKITVTYVEGEVEVVPLTMNEVECANATSNSLTFTWQPVDGAVGYKVSVDGGVNYGEVQDDTSYTWENLEPETEYTLYVKAIGNGLNTSDSEPVSSMATTDEEKEGVVTMSTTFTFTGLNGQKDFSVTRAPIKIAFAQVTGSYAPNDHGDGHVRVYNGNTMTFTGANIVKIELTYTTANYNGSGLSAGVGTLTQNTDTKTWTWVGSSTSVVLTGGTTQGRYSSIVVYYESDGTIPDPVQLEMGTVSCSAQTANTLTFKWDAVDNASYYEVSFNGGEVETITTTSYKATGLDAETTYSIAVKAIGDGTYYLDSEEVNATGTTTEEQSGSNLGSTYTYTFTSTQWSVAGNKTLNNLSWNMTGTGGTYFGYDSTKGQQFGSGTKPYTAVTLSTSAYEGGVGSIKLSTSGASSTNAKLIVKVNGKQYGSQISLTSTNTEYTFNAPSDDIQSGTIEILYTQTSKKAIYIKSIQIN